MTYMSVQFEFDDQSAVVSCNFSVSCQCHLMVIYPSWNWCVHVIAGCCLKQGNIIPVHTVLHHLEMLHVKG